MPSDPSDPTQGLRSEPPALNPSPFALNPSSSHEDLPRSQQPITIAPIAPDRSTPALAPNHPPSPTRKCTSFEIVFFYFYDAVALERSN